MMDQNFIENELVILSKATLDLFLRQDNPVDLISLYTFYYYTAKWQKTNQPKCTTSYTAKGLNRTEEWVRKNKKILIFLGIIEDYTDKDENNKIQGWYIKLNYIWGKNTVKEALEPEGGFPQRVAQEESNALSANTLNALSANNKSIRASVEAVNFSEDSKKNIPAKKDIELDPLIEFWNTMPNLTRHRPGTKLYKEISILLRTIQSGMFGRKYDLDEKYATDNHISSKTLSEKITSDEIKRIILNYSDELEVQNWPDTWPVDFYKFLYNKNTHKSFFFSKVGKEKKEIDVKILDQDVYCMYKRAFIKRELNDVQEDEFVKCVNFVVRRQREYHEKIGQYFTPTAFRGVSFYKTHIVFLTERYFDSGHFETRCIGNQTYWAKYLVWLGDNRGKEYNLMPNEKEIRIAKENFVERERKMRERENEEREERKEPRIITRNRWQLQEATG